MAPRIPLAASLLAALLLTALPARAASPAAARAGAHRFGAIGHSFRNGGGEARLRQAIAATGDASIAFVVATGIKGANESCGDKLYLRRRDLFEEASRPMIVVPAASDWSECRNSAGRTAAVERLNRLRELFFAQAQSLGAHKIALTRLSGSAQFRSYAENAYWEVGNVLYASINLPSNNNHYLPAAGRNSEFEDRLVANRAWLHRLLMLAKRKRRDAVVLFSEGDASHPADAASSGARDGYAEIRRQVGAFAQKFPGKLLLIDTAAVPSGAEPAIAWSGNLGQLSLGSAAVEVRVMPGAAALFTLKIAAPESAREQ